MATTLSDEICALWPQLKIYAKFLCRSSPNDVDDIVQTALLRAITKQHLFQPGTNLRAWLFTILHSVNTDRLRRRGRGKKIPVEECVIPIPPNQDDAVRLSELYTRIRELNKDQQEALRLSMMGYSDTEISRILNVVRGTIKSRLFRMRDYLWDGREARPVSPRKGYDVSGRPVVGKYQTMSERDEAIRQLWTDETLTTAEIGRLVGVHDSTVTNTVMKLGLPKRRPGARKRKENSTPRHNFKKPVEAVMPKPRPLPSAVMADSSFIKPPTMAQLMGKK